VKGDSINPDADANLKYYGDTYTMKEIISGEKVKPSQTMIDLAKKLDGYAKAKKKD
jgi:lipid-binding SYLF domain-containing protein